MLIPRPRRRIGRPRPQHPGPRYPHRPALRRLEQVMDGREEDLVDVDPHDDGSFPEYWWCQAPKGLATRRQLRDMGLRPGGQEPVARIECRGGRRFAWLYRIDLALPKLPMTLAKEAALDKAMAVRQTCPLCSRTYFACLPLKTLGSCLECHDGTPADPGSYIAPPAKQLLAA